MRIHKGIIAVLLLSACSTQKPAEPQLGLKAGVHLAQAAEASGDIELAENVYASASEAAPRDANVQLQYADALLRHGKVTQARDVLLSHVRTVTEPQSLHGGLGLTYILLGEPAQAIDQFDAMGRTSENRWVVDRAIALDMLGRHTDAQGLYRKALAVDLNNTAVISNLVLSLLMSGNKSEAIALAAPLANDLSPRVKATYGLVQVAKGNLAGAREALPGVDDGQLIRLAKAMEVHSQP